MRSMSCHAVYDAALGVVLTDWCALLPAGCTWSPGTWVCSSPCCWARSVSRARSRATGNLFWQHGLLLGGNTEGPSPGLVP
jgi:hypothetical protein